MDEKTSKIIKFNIILMIAEFIVLSFAVMAGLEYGFKAWNWIVVIVCISKQTYKRIYKKHLNRDAFFILFCFKKSK